MLEPNPQKRCSSDPLARRETFGSSGPWRDIHFLNIHHNNKHNNTDNDNDKVVVMITITRKHKQLLGTLLGTTILSQASFLKGGSPLSLPFAYLLSLSSRILCWSATHRVSRSQNSNYGFQRVWLKQNLTFLMFIRNVPEVLGQRTLVGIILVGGLGVNFLAPPRPPYVYIYIYIRMYKQDEIYINYVYTYTFIPHW